MCFKSAQLIRTHTHTLTCIFDLLKKVYEIILTHTHTKYTLTRAGASVSLVGGRCQKNRKFSTFFFAIISSVSLIYTRAHYTFTPFGTGTDGRVIKEKSNVFDTTAAAV